jgi:hypothetical protein
MGERQRMPAKRAAAIAMQVAPQVASRVALVIAFAALAACGSPRRDFIDGPPDLNGGGGDGGGATGDGGTSGDGGTGTHCGMPTAQATSLFLLNHSMKIVAVYSVDASCVEHATTTVDAGGTITLPTFVGAVWRVRDPMTNALLQEITLTNPVQQVAVIL